MSRYGTCGVEGDSSGYYVTFPSGTKTYTIESTASGYGIKEIFIPRDGGSGRVLWRSETAKYSVTFTADLTGENRIATWTSRGNENSGSIAITIYYQNSTQGWQNI